MVDIGTLSLIVLLGMFALLAIGMPLGFAKRFRGLVMSPDNALYVATDEGEIYRVSAQ